MQNSTNDLIVESFDRIRGFVNGNQTMTKSLEIALGFIKNMSPDNKKTFEFYDEMEWRIIQIDDLIGTYLSVEDAANHIYRLLFKPNDVKLIVFPDQKTKKMAIQDRDIRNFFNGNYPTLITTNDCKNF